jgi:two-component system response regulator DesR
VGFLLKDAPVDQLAIAIRRVMNGERVVDAKLAFAALSNGDNSLTGRERDVLKASLYGDTIADIALQLYLSESIVRNYISTAIQKLSAHNRMETAHLAKRKGLYNTLLPSPAATVRILRDCFRQVL